MHPPEIPSNLQYFLSIFWLSEFFVLCDLFFYLEG